MYNQYFDIKDHCREGLLKHLERAASKISIVDNPKILDVGCGSGTPTLFILEKFGGQITAIDSDPRSINVLRERVRKLNLLKQVNLSTQSLFDFKGDDSKFDLIIAEGILNVVGFQKGFLKLVQLVAEKGFIVIHDDFKDHTRKLEIIKDNDCKILDSFVLYEQKWWNDYNKCLAEQTSNNSDEEFLQLFESDLLEIDAFRTNPSAFCYIYYIVRRNDHCESGS